MNKKPKFKIILFSIILSCLFCACGNTSENSLNGTSNVAKKSSPVKNSESEKHNEYDEIVSVVDAYCEAIRERAPKKAASYCTDSLKDKIRKNMKPLNKKIKTAKSDLMNNFVSYAQEVFYYAADDDDDIIDAEYLRDDDDLQKAISDYIETIFTNVTIYSLPKKAKMVSDKKATVKVKIYMKDISEIETSFSDYIKNFLEEIVIDKLVDNSGFIKKQIAKKVMKEALIKCVNSLKKEYEETIDENLTAVNTYHLKKKKGNWIIIKIDTKNL